jgi:hypothetical protein
MQNAPPVAFPVGRFVWGRAGWMGASLLSASGLIGWQWSSGAAQTEVWLGWLFWAGCVGLAAVWAPRQTLRDGRLLWSGEDWFWLPDGAAARGELQRVSLWVGWDTDTRLLLWVQCTDEARPQPGALLTCAWLQKSAMPSKWHGFRCAVYSRPKPLDTLERPRAR